MTTRLVVLLPLLVSMMSAGASAGGREVTVLVTWYSKGGTTATMAKAVEEGARSVADTKVIARPIEMVTADDLLKADAIIVGSPVYNGGMAGEVKRFIDGWPFGRLKEKVGAAFCAGGGTSAGEELTLMDIIHSMLVFQFVIVGGETWHAAFGASAITEEGKPTGRRGVDEAARTKARGLGARVARVAQALARGR